MRALLLNTLGIQSYSYETTRMEAYILDFVKDMGVDVIYDNGNIYITKGRAVSYPCIVSHTDSVHKIIDDEDYTIIADNNYAIGFNKLLMQPTGCGGDDKVGIAICLQALLDFDNIKIAFFKDEEVGCIGSYEANLDWFKDCRFVLQCDRRGNGDFVNTIYGTQLQSKAFKRDVSYLLKKYNYKPTDGMLTDVYALKQLGLGVSVANISCGYYNPHDDNEIVVFEDVYNCYSLVCDIINKMPRVYIHEYKAQRSYGWSDWDYGYNKGYTKESQAPKTGGKYLCDCCSNMVDAKVFNDGYREWVCADCNEWLENEDSYQLKTI